MQSAVQQMAIAVEAIAVPKKVYISDQRVCESSFFKDSSQVKVAENIEK
jgi:hypothetical protein